MNNLSKPFVNLSDAIFYYLEPLLLLVMVATFWTPSPTRDRWLWLVFLLPVAWAPRWISTRRLWPNTPLQWLFLAFFALCVLNVWFAPYTRGLMMLGRPLLGAAIYVYFVEYVCRTHRLRRLLQVTTLFALLLGITALLSTQWNIKSEQLGIIVDLLPNVTTLPGIEGGFNANEVGGALVWVLPVVAALAVYRWRERLPRVGVTLAFLAVFAALFIGQSRLAIIGLLIALGLIARLLFPRGRPRNLALLAVIVLGVVEILIINNVFNLGLRQRMLERDEASFSDRVDIWRSGLAILRDYPLTGAGMSMFRYNPIRQLYPVEKYKDRILPHAHNEWVQIGSDLGVPGLLVFTGWYIVAGAMLLVSYRRGSAEVKALVVGVAGGLLAHAVYAAGDAIPLWDRFAFVFWWLLALAGAAYVQVTKTKTESPSSI
ncbi:MAG: O-antigen ligase family protein [Chloroflexi bacterium]|nr:O-antigen ligase family protein [Chloroflexota bacterium]